SPAGWGAAEGGGSPIARERARRRRRRGVDVARPGEPARLAGMEGAGRKWIMAARAASTARG
ncbi:hypothetical protein, partial [Sphingomonas sp. CCH5-D11]|uniref:hypothetical protein n=1 Tax=Sphingomonas sp. CCH5-D11 TaxID=1768786 RepID=UPI001E4F62F2